MGNCIGKSQPETEKELSKPAESAPAAATAVPSVDAVAPASAPIPAAAAVAGPNVLIVTSSPMGENSASNAVIKAFRENYAATHAGATFDVVDCASLPPFTAARVQAKFSLYGGATAADGVAEWKESKELISKLKSCDALVIGAPMWNFGIPAPLKLFFDHVAQPNLTFDPTTFAGLVTGKPCLVVRATGGTPVGSAMDTGLAYLHLVLGFIGFTHVDVIGVAGTATDAAGAIAKGSAEAVLLAPGFKFDSAREKISPPAEDSISTPSAAEPGSVISKDSKVLYISASPMGGNSASGKVCDALVSAMRGVEGVTVDTLDLAAMSADGSLKAYTAKRVMAKFATFGAGAMKTAEEMANGKLDAETAAEWEVTTSLIAQFEAADVYVFGVPMWNFGIPNHLKAYLDHIIQPHHTFNPATYAGLLQGKKAYVVAAAGGPTLNSPMDRVTPYMKQALGFMGVSDVAFAHVNGTAGGEPPVQAAIDTMKAAAGL